MLAALLLTACPGPAPSSASPTTAAEPAPPVAAIVPHTLEAHGHQRVDNYYWLRERDDPRVLAYLEAENAYTEAMTAGSAALRASLLAELTGRIKQDDASVPVRERDYEYYTRWEPGADHRKLCRTAVGGGDEQIMLDGEALAVGHDYFQLGAWELSENQQLLAYASDTVGRRFYTIHFKDLRTGATLPDLIPATTGDFVWANDDQTLFYTKQDPQTLRADRVYRHTLGADPSTDELVYAEADETFAVDLGKTKSRKYIVIHSGQTVSDEIRLLDADAPRSALRVVQARERGLEYELDHGGGDHLTIRTNLDALNFRLVEAPIERPGKQHWRELVGHRSDVLLEDFELFRDHLVLEQRRAGLIELEIRDRAGGEPRLLEFHDPAYLAYASGNLELDNPQLRYVYESMTTPASVYDYDLTTGEQVLRKQTEVLGGFEPRNYRSERLWAPTADGVEVPISLVYRERGEHDTGPRPLLLYAYGSYGATIEARFRAAYLSLLDRGFAFAIAHVRGGEELGRSWYEQGKLEHKRNSFTDFIACAEYLVAHGYADPRRLFAEGGSAGGLLIGAVINMRPDLFTGAIAAVPFVDVVTTMLDPDIPLTTGEYDEWGDPNRKADYETMLSYSPYDNVEAKAYPALLVTAGLHDSQVQYWEPAKWVAKLRALGTGDNLLLLRTDMSAGHGGRAGRLESLEQVAFEFAFLLELSGLQSAPE
jgi:oligopeptidase B